MTYKIEKGKPIPEPGSGSAWGKYPWRKMDVGDSILFTAEDAHNAQNAAHTWSRANNAKFATRKEGTGLRIWRIK